MSRIETLAEGITDDNREPAANAALVEGPAIVTPLHRQTRIISPVAGALPAWKKLTMVEIAYERDKFGPKDSPQARLRLDAGRFYADLWDGGQPSGKDSTEALNGSRGQGGGIPLGLKQLQCRDEIAKIKSKMGRMDYIIVMAFCGENYLPSEAVCLAGCDRETRVSGRVRDAMDELIVALGWQARAVG